MNFWNFIMSLFLSIYYALFPQAKSDSNVFLVSEVQQELNQAVRNSVRIQMQPCDGRPLPVGVSKFGGEPDVPEAFEWPYCQLENKAEGVVSSEPLMLLMQMNLAEVHPFDAAGELPESGMLYFFCGMESLYDDFTGDLGSVRVLYFPGDPATFQRRAFPQDLAEENRPPAVRLTFSEQPDMPGLEYFMVNHMEYFVNDNSMDETMQAQYDAEVESRGYVTGFCWNEAAYNCAIFKLLGYGDAVQNDVLYDRAGAELFARTGTCPKTEEIVSEARDWCLLFQMDSIWANREEVYPNGEYELLFGDVGRLYFCIRKDDLAARRFDRARVVFQWY